jgi:hypothetical protein
VDTSLRCRTIVPNTPMVANNMVGNNMVGEGMVGNNMVGEGMAVGPTSTDSRPPR